MFKGRQVYVLVLCAVVMIVTAVLQFLYPRVSFLLSGIMILIALVFVLYLRKMYGSIASEQQQLTVLFEYATEGIILTNRQGTIILINPAALELFKYNKDELLGKSIEVLIPGRFQPNHLKDREGFYKNPANRAMGHGRDLFARRKDGSELPVEVSLSFYKQKHDLFVIAFIVDITQRKESERRMIEQKEQLEQVSDSVRQLNA